MEWVKTSSIDGYIRDTRLKDTCLSILVTHKGRNGRRYVSLVDCEYGRITRRIGGKIIAWMPTPEPFTEQGAL